MNSFATQLEKYLSDFELTPQGWKFRERTFTYEGEDKAGQLTHFLYTEWYSKKDSHSARPTAYPTIRDNNFINNLSKANSSRSTFENNWTISAVHPSTVININRGSQTRSVNARHVSSTSGELVAGQTCEVHFPKEDIGLQQGFYYVYSNEYFISDGSMIRVYWNISSQGAASLVAAVTEVLNYYSLPFIFKCLDHPELYFRRDSAVIYIDAKYLPLLKHLLPQVNEMTGQHLEEDVPLGTHLFSSGVGMAENPETNESFGISRMRLIAEALLDAKESTTADLQLLAKKFEAAGLNIHTPWLNNASVNIFKNTP